MSQGQALASPASLGRPQERAEPMVRIDALRKFTEVVLALGGDPISLLTRAHIDAAALSQRHALIPYRALVLLLEDAAARLNCPDFGMRLAAAQGGLKVLGPLEFVMRNSRTLRDAFRYCTEHPQVYSTASRMRSQPGRGSGETFFRFEILLTRLPGHAQSIERALLLTQHTALNISAGRIRAREVWFTHQPLSPLSSYEAHFGAKVRFGQAVDGLLFEDRDLDLPLPDVDPQLYALATDFIARRFPASNPALGTRIRVMIERLLREGSCTHNRVAGMLGMHPRTLQRHLKAEGTSFEGVKDAVRRDLALRYLQHTRVPLLEIAQLLGYAETSALSRSCHRWFAASPRQLRRGAFNAAMNERRESA